MSFAFYASKPVSLVFVMMQLPWVPCRGPIESIRNASSLHFGLEGEIVSLKSSLRVTDLDGPTVRNPDVVARPLPLTCQDWAKLDLPEPGSPEESKRFEELYGLLPQLWSNLSAPGHVPQTVVVVPSMTLDVEELQKLKGQQHYEERLLFMLILLSNPKTRVIFVTSAPIHPFIIDYYLQLLPGIPASHARSRLELFATYDTSPKPLTQKILERPPLLRRIRKAIGGAENAHLTVFNVTNQEKRLSVALGIPLLGPDPKHLRYGSKSGCRKLFRECGVPLAEGFEDLKNEDDVLESLIELKAKCPTMKRAVIKINDGFSGDGNAILPLGPMEGLWKDRPAAKAKLAEMVRSDSRFQAAGMNWDGFIRKFGQMEGIVEEFIEGDDKLSPSVQMRLTPAGESQIISTHDQVLGGPDGQVFIGCTFPARRDYQELLHEAGQKVGEALAKEGVLGRLSVDFLCVPKPDKKGWDLFTVEINLRKGGTTHPFRTLQFLTGGRYDPETGLFQSGSGTPKFYFASDNLESTRYQGLSPEDLIDLTTHTGLHYNSASNTGVVFHMIGAISQYGKLGVTCIGDSHEEAAELYRSSVATLDHAVDKHDWIH